MLSPRHQRDEIIVLSQHPSGPKLGHESVPKAVKCSISTVQIDGNSQKTWTLEIDLIEYVQRLQNRINKLSHLMNNRHSLQAETRSTREQNTICLCRKHYSPNESFKMGSRSQSDGLESNDLLKHDNYLS